MFVCKKGFEVKALCSNSHYIGTWSHDLGPYCRLSVYYKNMKEAEEALRSKNFTHRSCVENDYCSGESGCQIKEVKNV